jgi:rod shape-determining protein MreD
MVAQSLKTQNRTTKPFVFGIVMLNIVLWIINFSLFSVFSIGSVHPDISMLTTIVVACYFGAEAGVITGFFSGVLFDLGLTTPFGFSPLTLVTLGFFLGVAFAKKNQFSRFSLALTAGFGAMIYEILYASISQLAGQPHMISAKLVFIISVAFLTNFVFVVLFARFIGWSLFNKINNPFSRKRFVR